jgi:hypothetical protein
LISGLCRPRYELSQPITLLPSQLSRTRSVLRELNCAVRLFQSVLVLSLAIERNGKSKYDDRIRLRGKRIDRFPQVSLGAGKVVFLEFKGSDD